MTGILGMDLQKKGGPREQASYEAGQSYTTQVAVSDGKSTPVVLSMVFDGSVTMITIDPSQTFQVIEGFGGFGAKDVYWSSGPFTSPDFVSALIDDLGLTILRDNIPSNFEVENDNEDPFLTDLSKFNIHSATPGHDGKLADHLQFLKDMKAAGLKKLVVSVWTPAPWMKYNNKIGNGTANQNTAPAYTTMPNANTNQLKTDMYQEFAEMCAAYIKIIKRETGLDVYALSIQNEPRFSQFYASCVYNGEALRDVVRVVGERLQNEGFATRLFVPEDVGWFDGANGLVQPILNDPVARSYVSFIATHGYAFDGITASSSDALTWEKMYNWGAPYHKPLWMTETSGFENDYAGAMKMAKAMYTALRFGNISAWLFWSLSTNSLDAFSLMSSSGQKSKRYWVSKNFYRYIRPGATRIKATAPENSGIYALAFTHPAEASQTILFINDNSTGRFIKLDGPSLLSQYDLFVTTEEDDCKGYGMVNAGEAIFLPSTAVVTLYKKK